MRRLWVVVCLTTAAFLVIPATGWGRKHHRSHKHHKSHKQRHQKHVRRHRHRRHKAQSHRHHGVASPTVSSGTAGTGGRIQHVVWVLMENKAYGQVIGSSQAPYVNSLANTYGLATNYSAVSHPSLPNYIALTSGSTQGITDDSDPSSHPLTVPSIFSELPGGQSRSLEQDMPTSCDQGNSGNYAVRHDPEAYYTNLGSDCGNLDVPFGSSPDLSAKFTFITPNVCNDMHDCGVGTGDSFLQSYVPQLMATSQYQAGTTAIFIVWDEDDGSANNQVPLIVISPYTHGVKDGTSYTHYSLLKTTEQLLGVPQLANAGSANSMLGKFGF